MARLVINPGSPSAWEIELKPGPNYVGRGFANDIKIPDPSVSSSHCEIMVDPSSTVIKDLGSTNGTFVNRAPVREASLLPGHTIHLGGVEVLFLAESAGGVTIPAPPPPPPPSTVRFASPGGNPVSAPRMGISPALAAPAPPPPPTAPPLPPPIATAAPVASGGKCKHHPRTLGRFFCNQCQQYYCELCVNSRNVGGASHKFCRHCGAECVAVQVQIARAAGPKGFFSQLPGALVYPFRGSGLLVMIASMLVFAGLEMISGGLFGLFFTIIALGWLFSFMQAIIHSTANQEEQMPELPGFDDVFGGAFRLITTVLVCFGIPIALGLTKVFSETEVPITAIIATIVLGCLYFPMAFLAVAMKDTVVAANPLVVIPAILKVPAEYLVTAIIMVSVFGMRQLGDFVVGMLRSAGYSTHSMSTLLTTFAVRAFWSLLSVYLLTVSMRVLGLLYVTKKERLGWFSR